MKRKLVYLLIICFSLSILGLALHHHADGVPHDNCSICSYVSHHLSFTFQDLPQISPPASDIPLISLENSVNHPISVVSPQSIRAPPA